MTISTDPRQWYSCVMGAAPRFAQQTLTLIWTLTDLAGVAPNRIIVRAPAEADTTTRRQIEALGVETVTYHPFRDGHPHCNKLRQLEDPRFDRADIVVLCDTDLAFASAIDDVFSSTAIRAKIVDLPNPSLEEWHRILVEAGLPDELELTTTSFGPHTTPRVNCNGGLYLLPGYIVPALREAWPRWTNWLIDRSHLMAGPARVHVDQVAFGLAILELRARLDLLPLQLNYPTHAFVQPKPDTEPRVLHYHDHVDASGFLLPVGSPRVDAQITRVNDAIRSRRQRHFENPSFWNFRYAHAPDLGSGIGSRGQSLEYKRDLLAREVTPDDTVLDVGCGDLEVSRVLATTQYTGVDISAEALAIARTKRPEWTFFAGDLHTLALEPHDAVVCFDVLIHQRHESAYRALLGSLLHLARRTLIVSGYNQTPWHKSEITFFHEPLTTSLARLVDPSRVEIIGGYRDTTVVRVSLEPFDDSSSMRARLASWCEYATPLGRFLSIPGDLISTQFDAFGGHTRNELAMVSSLVEDGDTIVDVGAHIGSYAIPLARRTGPQGLVVAVEPDAANTELLHQNVVRNDMADRIRVVTAVVGDDPSVALQPVRNDENTGALYFVPGEATDRPPVVSVDRVVSEHAASRRIALIKIDVEGHELSVLRSAKETIARDRPIVYCEVVREQLARHATRPADIGAFFHERGYVFYRNQGERNSSHDRFHIARLASIEEGGAFFDCLAIPAEHASTLVSRGLLPEDRE